MSKRERELSPEEIRRREEEAFAIFTTEKPSDEELRRASDLMRSTIPRLPDWRGYPRESLPKSPE